MSDMNRVDVYEMSAEAGKLNLEVWVDGSLVGNVRLEGRDRWWVVIEETIDVADLDGRRWAYYGDVYRGVKETVAASLDPVF